MENCNARRINSGWIEENTLAILDVTGAKDTQDAHDDRIAFLEAVRSTSIVPESGNPPTNKMFEAVFQIMRVGSSLELMMSSYQLLIELDKCFPRLYITNLEKSKHSRLELVVVKEAWSPFVLSMDTASSEHKADNRISGGPMDSSGFYLLIQNLAEVANETSFQALDMKSLGNMLLLQYLVNVFEGDFLPRNRVYKESMNWALLRESLLNVLLGSRRISYKALVKDCLSIMCILSQFHTGFSSDLKYPENSASKPSEKSDTAVAIASLEVGKNTCVAIQKLMIMIMELDESKKKADMEGYTTRADGLRIPLVEIILDELTYNKNILFPFLQVFNEPKWKLELVVQYFWKYGAKPAFHTRRSNVSTDDATFSGVLKCFSNSTSIKGIVKKISTEVIQLLLAHAFQAHLSLAFQQPPFEGIFNSEEEARSCSLVEICENIISAITSLKRIDQRMEIFPFGKEALFTAATILSTGS